MGSFWRHVGNGFVAVGKGAAKAALWASQHPQVIAGVIAISGNAKAIQVGNEVLPIASAIGSSINNG